MQATKLKNLLGVDKALPLLLVTVSNSKDVAVSKFSNKSELLTSLDIGQDGVFESVREWVAASDSYYAYAEVAATEQHIENIRKDLKCTELLDKLIEGARNES